ncbi:MAG: DUF4446 family protein [Actinomycetes bacterium]
MPVAASASGAGSSTVALLAVAIALLALVVAVVALARLGALRRAYSLLQGQGPQGDFVTVVRRQIDEVTTLREHLGQLDTAVAAARVDVADAIRHVAVVRYDAFGDMGGRLSFTAALLDDAGDGIVLTSINGRSETRTYAKGVKAGVSDVALSPEEEQAVAYARRR